MYSIQSIPISSEQNVKNAKNKTPKQCAFDWLLPENESCLYYDVIGRQLVKQNSAFATTDASVTNKTGFERVRNQLARIDAHLFSFIVCSVFVGTECIPSEFDEEFGAFEDENNFEHVCCRQCNEKPTDVTLFYMLHCVALEGTSRFLNGIVDYICTDCAMDVCMFEIENTANEQSLERWKNTLSVIEEKTDKGALCIYPTDFYRLLSLVSGIVGYDVGEMQPFIDLFIQQQFASQQIDKLFSKNTFGDTQNNVDCFMECTVCCEHVTCKSSSIGVLSTAYYNTTRIIAVPYFVCNDCKKIWQSNQFASQRFTRLLMLHRDAMRHCFKASLQYFLCTPLQILGVDFVPFLKNNVEQWTQFCKEESKKDTNKSNGVDTLLWTVESDMLNKVFGLIRLEQQSKNACEILTYIQNDPCVKALNICVKKCLCENCIVKNLAFIEILKYYELARDEQSKEATDALDKMVSEFSELCRGDVANSVLRKISPPQQQRTRKCCRDVSTSPTVQADDEKFYRWRLPLKKHPRRNRVQCTQKYSETLLVKEEMEKFYDESCFFLSPMF